MPPTPTFSGGWITGRFRGHYTSTARGMVRTEHVEIRPVRLLRGTLTDARFSPFGPQVETGALRQPTLDEVWVAAGLGLDGHPQWQRLSVSDVWLFEPVKGAVELVGAAGLGEVSGTLWGRLAGGEDAPIGAIEPVPEQIPEMDDE